MGWDRMGGAREGGKDRKGGRKRRGIETEKGREKDVFQLKGFSLMARCDCERKSREIKSLCRGLKAQGEERDHIERRAYSRMYGEIKQKYAIKPIITQHHSHNAPLYQEIYQTNFPPSPSPPPPLPRLGTYNICALPTIPSSLYAVLLIPPDTSIYRVRVEYFDTLIAG